jgi:FlaA1/EpsC-like NDP-sugar epimerase
VVYLSLSLCSSLVCHGPVIVGSTVLARGTLLCNRPSLELHQLVVLEKTIALYGLIFLTLCIVLYPTCIPRSVGILQPAIMFIGMMMHRVGRGLWYDHIESRIDDYSALTPVLICGAGSAGRLLAGSLKRSDFAIRDSR